jgi:hypothetical protein
LLHNTRERALAEADGELLIGSIKLQSVELARVVSLHFNVKADFGSHVTQLGLLRLRRRLLLRRCRGWRLRSRLLTTSAHDSRNNG